MYTVYTFTQNQLHTYLKTLHNATINLTMYVTTIIVSLFYPYIKEF